MAGRKLISQVLDVQCIVIIIITGAVIRALMVAVVVAEAKLAGIVAHKPLHNENAFANPVVTGLL